jgi:RNA polymerase sigma-70 factor (ECF subfamily)
MNAGSGDTQLDRDRALAASVAGGDAPAFDAFFREYFPRLYRFALSRVDNDPSLAEEVVQRTMCIVVRKMGTYRGEALLFTWLCQICRNELSAVYRQRGEDLRVDVPLDDHPAVQAALESMMGTDHLPDATRHRDEIAGLVRSTLEHLPENYATALELKYIGGFSVAEIARRLGVGEKAAESVLSRARAAFREGFRSVWDVDAGFVTD